MGDVWEVISSVQDAADAARDAQRRQKIGFWRAAVAMVGVVWTVAGILPGIPAMMSINRWMKGKSSRPVVAMVMGLVTVAFVAGALAALPFVLIVGEGTATAVLVVRTAFAAAGALATLWFLGRYLFARPRRPQPAPSSPEQVGAAPSGSPATAAPVVPGRPVDAGPVDAGGADGLRTGRS